MKRFVCGVLMAGVLLGCGCSRWAERRFIAQFEGKPAPDFALEDLAGNTVKLSDQRGKAVLLTFFAFG